MTEIEALCTKKGEFFSDTDMSLRKQYWTCDDGLKVAGYRSWTDSSMLSRSRTDHYKSVGKRI
jgi:hypothetical protein